MGKFMGKLIIILIIGGVILSFKMGEKGQASDKVKEQTQALIKVMPSYATESAYLDQIFTACYDGAFEGAYDIGGGRRQGASFDMKKYAEDVFARMMERAKADQKETIVKELEVITTALSISAKKNNMDTQ